MANVQYDFSIIIQKYQKIKLAYKITTTTKTLFYYVRSVTWFIQRHFLLHACKMNMTLTYESTLYTPGRTRERAYNDFT